MNCTKCNAPNAPEAKFCTNCGANIAPPQVAATSDQQTINALLIIIGIDYLFSSVMFLIQKLLIPYLSAHGSVDHIDMIFKTYSWASDIVILIAMFFFLATIKNNTAKTAIVVFIVLRIIFLIGYRLFPLSF